MSAISHASAILPSTEVRDHSLIDLERLAMTRQAANSEVMVPVRTTRAISTPSRTTTFRTSCRMPGARGQSGPTASDVMIPWLPAVPRVAPQAGHLHFVAS